MKIYQENITIAANYKCIETSLIAGYISRVSRAGKALDGTDGWRPCDTDVAMRCYGIMQIPEYLNPNTKDGIGGLDYLGDSIELIIKSIDSVSAIHFGFDDDQRQEEELQ